ncbi:helix-turn-helix transcriptional regulator [Marinobacterium marinum]|uniref:AlpA family phage regulatory protein n=1 Tax=Marinobacterium marinum TaxID=2756129 RepID=A0A7W1WXA9_9GAMM|nr:AlpA family phage regulatory protein [Marinobacterium marinum]MBA4501844.1 AlpA family phage regulatory protein [Marinobacterium marinum]
MKITQKTELLRTKAAAALLGVSTTTLWRLEQSDPTFPRKIVITSRCVGWRAESLLNWLEGKEAGRV